MKKVMCLVSVLLVGGCATIMNGPTQEITVTSDPPGAIVTPTDYKCWIKTPGIITLDRNNNTVLTARLYGYKDAKQEISWGISPWAFGNLVVLQYPWAIVGCQFADADSIGNLSPNEVHFELIKK